MRSVIAAIFAKRSPVSVAVVIVAEMKKVRCARDKGGEREREKRGTRIHGQSYVIEVSTNLSTTQTAAGGNLSKVSLDDDPVIRLFPI